MAFPSRGITHHPTVTGTRRMIASAHTIASLAGVRILLQRGNAFDSTVTVASTLDVVEPYMSCIAGCGYMLIYSAKNRIRVLDYMGTSPYQATLDAYSKPKSNEVGIEERIPSQIREELTARGHNVRAFHLDSSSRRQGITVDQVEGTFMGDAHPRRDGYAIEIQFDALLR